MKSIFEKIIDKEIPGEIIYENEEFICLLDIYPKRLGHTLIIPKTKKENILEESEETIKEMFKIAKALKPIYEQVLDAKGIRLISNINKEAKQVIFHTHLHFIPYYDEEKKGKNELLNANQITLLKEKIMNFYS